MVSKAWEPIGGQYDRQSTYIVIGLCPTYISLYVSGPGIQSTSENSDGFVIPVHLEHVDEPQVHVCQHHRPASGDGGGHELAGSPPFSCIPVRPKLKPHKIKQTFRVNVEIPDPTINRNPRKHVEDGHVHLFGFEKAKHIRCVRQIPVVTAQTLNVKAYRRSYHHGSEKSLTHFSTEIKPISQ